MKGWGYETYLLNNYGVAVHPKGNQFWVFIGRTHVEAETPPDVESWLIWKDPDAGKDWGQEEKGTTEDEMVGWHHWLNGHGFGWTPGVGDGQGGLACCSSWGYKESDMTERLNWTELKVSVEAGACDKLEELCICKLHWWHWIETFMKHNLNFWGSFFYCVFTFWMLYFEALKPLILMKFKLPGFSFCYCAFLVSVKKLLFNPRSQAKYVFF